MGRRRSARIGLSLVGLLFVGLSFAGCGAGPAGATGAEAGAAAGLSPVAAARPAAGEVPAASPTTAPAVVGTARRASSPARTNAVPVPAPVPAPRTSVAAARVAGLDVSKWQPDIDWPRVRAAGYRFVYVSVVGSDGLNPRFAEQWRGALAGGLYRGAYYFGDPTPATGTSGTGPGDTGKNQADRFLALVGNLRDGSTLRPMLDIERNPHRPACDGVSPPGWETYIRAFVDEMNRRAGVTPILYTAATFWRTCVGNSTAFARTIRLFAAQPRVASPRPFAGWPEVTFWQHSVGRIPGITAATDQDTFLGTLADLRALLVPRG